MVEHLIQIQEEEKGSELPRKMAGEDRRILDAISIIHEVTSELGFRRAFFTLNFNLEWLEQERSLRPGPTQQH